MPGDNPTQTSVDLEAKARVFLFSDELTEKTSQLAKIFGLSDKAQDDLAVLENAVVFKEISISAFIEKIKNLPLSSKKSSADFALAVAESFLLPLNEYLDGEPKRLLEKIAPKSQVVFRESLPRPKETSIKSLPVKPVDPRAVKIAEAVITEINLGDKNLESKLREIVVARVTGAKDDLETKAMLKRSAQTGGVGLEDSLADTLLGLIKTKAGETPKTEIQNSSKPVKEQINSSVVIPNLIGDPVFDSAQTQRKNVDSLARGERRAGVNPAELRGGNDKTNEPKLAGFVAPAKSLQATSPDGKAIEDPRQSRDYKLQATSPKLTTDWLQSEKPKKSEPNSGLLTTRYSPPTSGKPLTEAEDQELKTIKEKMTAADVIPAIRPQAHDQLTKAGTQNTASQSNEKLVEQVLAAVQFPFKDDVQKTRFINAVKNRMRGIRDQFETKELLLRSENLGGVGLAEPVADQAIGMIEKIVGEQNRRLTVAKKEELQMLAAQAKTALAQKTQARLDQELKDQEVRYKNLVTDKIKGAMDRPLGFLKKKATPTVEVPEIMMPKKESAKMTVPLSRPKMDDIKFSPTLVGPIEELKNFTLKDWQTLGAKSSVISQKLSVLRHESYTKYMTALAAFKESPLFALAQEILFESLSKNMPLSGLIEMRKKEDRPYLSENEIGDIMNIE